MAWKWKPPRLTIGDIGVLVLLTALDLTIARGASLALSVGDPVVAAFVRLPMMNALLFVGCRFREAARRTPQAWAWWIAGAAGIFAVDPLWRAWGTTGFQVLFELVAVLVFWFGGFTGRFINNPFPFATLPRTSTEALVMIVVSALAMLVANLPPALAAGVAGRLAARRWPTPSSAPLPRPAE